MTFDFNLAREVARLDGLAQGDLVRQREVTPRELVQAAIDRIEAGNTTLNAVVHRRFEEALHEADQMARDPSAPFAGVPFLIKDLGTPQAGVPQTQGNIALKRIHHTPDADSESGRRFRDSGLITLGVTNMPEFGMHADTQPLAFGPTRNPWCLDRSVGGSSGGAAAAVAACFVPIAGGGDGGGSVRIPAAWCGVVGLKPSRGRMPQPVGPIDAIWSTESVITRTVRDTAAALDAVNGALPGDLYGLPRPDASYLESLNPPDRALRVGLLSEGPAGVAVNAECVRAVEETGALLHHAGHDVEAAHPSALLEPVPEWVDRILWLYEGTNRLVDQLENILGRPLDEDDVEPYLWHRFKESQPVSTADLRASLGWYLARSARMLEWWEQGFDLLVTPITNEPPDRLADLAAETPTESWRTLRRHCTFTEPFNASGQPAIALPIRWTDDDIPVGVQIAAAKGAERLLLQVAKQLEDAIGWPSRTPDDRRASLNLNGAG